MPSDPFEMAMSIARFATNSGISQAWFALAYAGFQPRDGTPDEQRHFIEPVPLPLRLALKLLGGRALASYRTKLYGEGD